VLLKGGKISQKLLEKLDNLSKQTNKSHTTQRMNRLANYDHNINDKSEGQNQELTLKIIRGADNE